MEPAVQARLFSALENRTFLRVGGKEAVHFDVRVVAATHRNLEQAVSAGHFREDLYYQLNVVPLHIPPLREHAEDVPELLDYFLALFAAQENLPLRRISQQAQNRLRNHDWAGNVRELKNLVQRLLILGHGDEITVADVDQALGMRQPGKTSAAFDLPLRQARTQFEREYFEQLLQANADNMGQMAHKAGIERTHLYRKLRALGLRK